MDKVKCLWILFWKPFTEFGKFVFVLNCFFLISLSFSAYAQAPQAKPATSQKAYTLEAEVDVYEKPDFDSKIIGQLTRGQVYDISVKTVGPFYKIRLRPGVLGYVSDAEITLGTLKQPKAATKKSSKAKKQSEPEKPSKPFFAKRYRGLVVEQQNFTESSLGAVRSESLPFYGIKWSGFNTLFSGDVYADGEILFHSGAPSYYKTITGQNASGMILQANFLFETPTMEGRHHLFYYGFGPMFRYSEFNASVLDTSTGMVSNFVLTDMVLGAIFNVGLAFEIGPCALRSDVRYHIEARQYLGYGLSLQFAF